MKQKMIALLLGVCMMATMLVGCGNAEGKETEKNNVNESEVVTESESGNEKESELTETTETEGAEVQDTESKVEDTTNSEQAQNKPSGDTNNKPQNNNTPSNNQGQNNSSSSQETWTDAEGNVLSKNPALCSHVNSECLTKEKEVIGDIVAQYDTGAYERQTTIVYSVSCTWCNADLNKQKETPGRRIQYLDQVTDFVGEFKRAGGYGVTGGKWNIARQQAGHELYNIFFVSNADEIGAQMVKYVAGKIDSVNVEIDINTDDYVIMMQTQDDLHDSNGAPKEPPLYDPYVNGTKYKDLCTFSYAWGNTNRMIEIYIFANLPK